MSPAAARIRRIVPAPMWYPKAEELALDAPVAPPRVLPGQLFDQLPHLLGDRRTSSAVWVGPLILDQAPVPCEQGARRHDPMQPEVPGQQS